MKKYKLFKKEIGSSKEDLFFEDQSEKEILQFDFWKKDFIFLTKEEILALRDKKLLNLIDAVENPNLFFKPIRLFKPQDIIYRENIDTIHILENGGSNIKNIAIGGGLESSFNPSESHKVYEYIKKYDVDKLHARFCFGQNIFYISIQEINQIFSYKNGKINKILGNGYPGYSVASKIENVQINKPKGLCYERGKIYFCDYGNGCIRSYDEKNVDLFWGSPINKGVLPEQISFNKRKMFFLGDNKIWNEDNRIVHKSEGRILSFKFKDKELYILEELNYDR